MWCTRSELQPCSSKKSLSTLICSFHRIILNSWDKYVYIYLDLSVIEVTSSRAHPKRPADPWQVMFYSGTYHGSPERQLSDNDLRVQAHALRFGYSRIIYSWSSLRRRIIAMSGPNNTSVFNFKIGGLSKTPARTVPLWLISQAWIKHLEKNKNQRGV